MNREQINYIIQYADVVLVAEKIGVPMQGCGDKILILCPGHEEHTGHMDRNFGSCMLTQHGYYCFAHGKATNVIKMVMEQSQINGQPFSFYEAAEYVATVCGMDIGDANDMNSENVHVDYFPFTRQEMSLLGIELYPQKDKVYMEFSDEKQGELFYLYQKTIINKNMPQTGFNLYQGLKKDDTDKIEKITLQPCFLKTKNSFEYSWERFYRENKKECLRVIRINAEKTMNNTKKTYYGILEKPYLLNQLNIQTDYQLLLSNLQRRIQELEKLIQKIDNEQRRKNYVYH